MDAIQLRFMALVLKFLIVLYYRTLLLPLDDDKKILHDANDMVILLEARARSIV